MKNDNYYANMFNKVADHKARRLANRLKRKAKWIKRRIKKNGEPVRGIEVTQ